jgi:hypothetical protein
MAGLLPALTAAALILSPGTSFGAAIVERAVAPRPIGELKRTATIHLGKTADWVAITADAVWVGSTGPFAQAGAATHTTALGIPGKGGDIGFGDGMIWTTVAKVPLSMIDGAHALAGCKDSH